jgi:hypothetical protein
MRTKTNTILVCLCLFIFTGNVILAQESTNKLEKKEDIQWNVHRKEIGLDFKFLDRNLNLNSIGSNLIFKKHFGEKRFISLNEKKAFRIQFGGYGDLPVGDQDTLGRYATFTNVNFREGTYLNIRALVGIEWQKQMKRLQLYYGFDTGLEYFESTRSNSISYYFSNGVVVGYGLTDESELRVPIYGFIGLKYFLHPRVSVSIESALSIGIGWLTFSRSRYDSAGDLEFVSDEGKRREVNFDTDYLRYLNVNFHF